MDRLLKVSYIHRYRYQVLKTKIGKGGKLIRGDEQGSPIIMAGVFSNVYINKTKIENQKYILIITRDTSKSHFGRLRLKYGPSNTYDDEESGISSQMKIYN